MRGCYVQLRDILRHYARVIRHWYAFILIGSAVGTLITLGISLIITPTYQASALIRVNGQATTTPGDISNNQALAVSYALLVTSPDVLQTVAARLPGTTVNQLKNVVSDSPMENTEIIEVRAQAETAHMAADIANMVATVFIQVEITRESTHLQSSLDAYAQNLANAKTALDSAQQQLTALQNAHASDDTIAHQKNLLDTYQSSYTYLLMGYDQLQTQKFLVGNTLSITQLALPPDSPSSPQVALNTLLAGLLSVVLMLVLVLLLDWMDVTIKTTDDVVFLTGLEPLGSVPLDNSSTLMAAVSSVDNSLIGEAFATIGTNFLAISKGQRSILVTALQQGVGTSSTALHLAISLVQSGKRVLLVDANLRRPVLHEVFQCDNSKGLANSLIDVHLFQNPAAGLPTLWLNQWKTAMPNLWFLPSGPQTPYAPVVLRMPELRTLQHYLLGRYEVTDSYEVQPTLQRSQPLIDYIIFDSLSLEEGNDAIALAAMTDGSVLVTEAGKAHKEMLDRARATLQRLGSSIIGIVVNRQKTRHNSYFYASEPGKRSTWEASDRQPEWLRAPAPPLFPTLPGPLSSASPEMVPQHSLPLALWEEKTAALPSPGSLTDEKLVPSEQSGQSGPGVRDTPPFLQPLEHIRMHRSRPQFISRIWTHDASDDEGKARST